MTTIMPLKKKCHFRFIGDAFNMVKIPLQIQVSSSATLNRLIPVKMPRRPPTRPREMEKYLNNKKNLKST